MSRAEFNRELEAEVDRLRKYAASLSDLELDKSLKFAILVEDSASYNNGCANCNDDEFCIHCEYSQARRQILAEEQNKRLNVEVISLLPDA